MYIWRLVNNMCISTAYLNKKESDKIIMKNVVSIEYFKNKVILTDIFEKKLSVDSSNLFTNLEEGYILIKDN